MLILAHRGLWNGAAENSISAISQALLLGFSVETDMRKTKDNNFVIIHNNIVNPGARYEKMLTLRELLNLFLRRYNPIKKQILALHMKSFEEGVEEKIVNEINNFAQENSVFDIYKKIFIFDITKNVAANIKKMNPLLRIAYSVGEDTHFPNIRYPTIYTTADIEKDECCDYVWADEWSGKLYSYSFIKKMHKIGKLVYAVSPELHKDTDPSHFHANNLEKIKKDWKNLIKWGVDGICTDYPNKLKNLLEDEKN